MEIFVVIEPSPSMGSKIEVEYTVHTLRDHSYMAYMEVFPQTDMAVHTNRDFLLCHLFTNLLI